MSISPQLVSSLTTQRLAGFRVAVGFARCWGPLGRGSATFVHPADVVSGAAAAVEVVAGVVVFLDFELPPHPPPARAARTASTARLRGMAGEDTGAPD